MKTTAPPCRAMLLLAAALLGAAALSCSPETPQTGSQTNWFRTCDSVSECGGLDCVCGTCTTSCSALDPCSGGTVSSCLSTADAGVEAMCGNQMLSTAICVALCQEDGDCPSTLVCSVGTCVPPTSATPKLAVDTTANHQSLIGFGASLAYGEDELAARSDKETVYDALFGDSGIDVVRLRNRYEVGKEADVAITAEILSAAAARMGRDPVLLMTSGSPPPNLKANGARFCAGNLDTCTLSKLDDGSFDYPGFAQFWRDSLDTYAAEGILPDYVGIQNNPDWVPSSSGPNEACRFLPEEGSELVDVDGVETAVDYPGYLEALTSVSQAIVDATSPPQLIGPETSTIDSAAAYTSSLTSGLVTALACHLYESDAASIDAAALDDLKGLAEQEGLPVFQTEMLADGLDTAILIHHAMVDLDARMYLQNDFISSADALQPNPFALVGLLSDGFETQGPYHAIRHYASHTEPDWVRIDAVMATTDVLASAWLAPDAQALTLILVNPSSAQKRLELNINDQRASLAQSEVTRTIFEGAEASLIVGELPDTNLVTLPARSIVTVALWN